MVPLAAHTLSRLNGPVSLCTWQRYDSTTFDNTGKDAEEQRVVKEDREVKEVDRLTTLVFEEIDKSVESALGDKPVGEIVDLEEIRKAKKSKWKPTLV